ncbi:MAG: DUF177 domain-containing protein [Elusimicrobiota bacterium]
MIKNEFIYDFKKIFENGGLCESFDINIDSFKDSFSNMVQPENIYVEIVFSVLDNSISLKGRIEASVKQLCSRCGMPFKTVLKGDFEDLYPTGNNEIDIQPLIREALTLSEPMKAICSPNCKMQHLEYFDYKRFDINAEKQGAYYAKSKTKTHKIQKR